MIKIAIINVIFLSLSFPALAQPGIAGKWKTVDDNSGEVKSIVEIREQNGQIYGKIVKLFLDEGEDQDPKCTKCDPEDSRHMQKILGMEIMRGLVKNGNEYSGGNILDPEVGKIYRCKIWLEDGKLKVRGYWGPFYRTQTWIR